MPQLEEVATELSIASNPLYEVSFPVLTHAGYYVGLFSGKPV
ncbi:MAG: hypothetical protein ACLU4N_15085 [Butyricimonas faecihominis]